MSDSSGNWDLLKQCKPVISPNVEYESRFVRKERWLVLRNGINGDHLRLNPSASELLAQLDGKTSLDSLCNEEEEGGYTPNQICAWLGPLCYSGLVSLGSASEDERLLKQFKAQNAVARKVRFSNPLSLKFPLHNPDRWLDKLVAGVPWLFSRWFLAAVLIFIGSVCLAALMNTAAISQAFARVASSPTHWWLYFVMYPALKAIHELGHALVIKRWGGSVHETGITFLVLMPIPYVDASDAWMFPSRSQRMLVGAAGMLAECSIAALGLIVFLLVQPGMLQEVGFALFLMGSISTLLFNANPLLKFDGYYILQDWLEIPNLSTRSQAYCRFLVRKYIFKVKNAVSPASAKGERRWLLSYGILATLYRFFVTAVIALYLASKFFIIGALLALFALYQLLINPVLKLVRYLRTSPELNDIRDRSIAISGGVAFFAATLIAFMPMPSSTRTEGVVWVPNQAQVFSNQAGLIEELYVEPGQRVETGQLLLRLSSPAISTEKLVLESRIKSANIKYRAMQQNDTNKAQQLKADIESYQRELIELNGRVNRLDIVAQNNGQFVVDKDGLALGRHVKQGELLAYIVNKKELMVKAVLAQQRIERVQAGVERAQIRLADQFSESIDATLTRQTPAALNSLPSPALAYDGRSGIAVASQSDEELKTLERVFHIELALPNEIAVAGIGGRAYVTLHHQPESLGRRWWRSTRQLLLKQLTV